MGSRMGECVRLLSQDLKNATKKEGSKRFSLGFEPKTYILPPVPLFPQVYTWSQHPQLETRTEIDIVPIVLRVGEPCLVNIQYILQVALV